jgi:hypothetical protein
LWKNERISDDAFDFTEREEEEKQKRRMEEKREKDLEREIADLSLQQQRKVKKQQQRSDAAKKRVAAAAADDDEEEMGAEKDGDGAELQLEDAVSVDPKAVERKNRRALRKEKSRIMLVRSSSTLLYQIMREGAITLQHTQQQQQQQLSSASSSTSSSSQSQQADESKEVAKSPSHSPVSPRANSGSKVVSGKSKSENTSPGKGTKVAIKKKDKKRRKAGIAASAGMVETRTHYQDNESPPRLRLSSFSAETLPTLQVASSPEPETPMPSVASTPTAAAAVRPVLPPALYNLKSLCLKNCPKVRTRPHDRTRTTARARIGGRLTFPLIR